MIGAIALWILMTYVASKAAEQYRDDFVAACRHHGLTDEQIAHLLGISRGQFADQKAITQHLSAYRVADLPHSIRVWLHKLQAERLGLTVLDNGPLGEFLASALRRRQRRRQLKMALPEQRERQLA